MPDDHRGDAGGEPKHDGYCHRESTAWELRDGFWCAQTHGVWNRYMEATDSWKPLDDSSGETRPASPDSLQHADPRVSAATSATEDAAPQTAPPATATDPARLQAQLETELAALFPDHRDQTLANEFHALERKRGQWSSKYIAEQKAQLDSALAALLPGRPGLVVTAKLRALAHQQLPARYAADQQATLERELQVKQAVTHGASAPTARS